ncbi:transcriptional regulator, AraC family protein [Roseobacter sp. CCS2]|nr:transcriptional regulator, AraC family protein [Roseobacter sp. CCS2]
MATARIKIIVAGQGFFDIAGQIRTAFVVGSRATPIDVSYSENASCTEFTLPAWVGTAVLGVSGRELSHEVHDLSDLPVTPFLTAIQRDAPDAPDIARLAYMNWSAWRGTADAQIAQRVWHTLQAAPARKLSDIADHLGLSDRRVRAAVREETGLTAAQWRKLIRLEKSSHAITTSIEPMSAVAFNSGYADQSHMNRDFRELAGTSPAMLRRSALSG